MLHDDLTIFCLKILWNQLCGIHDSLGAFDQSMTVTWLTQIEKEEKENGPISSTRNEQSLLKKRPSASAKIEEISMYYRAWWRRMMYKKESINITRVSMCCCCCCAHRPINQYPPRVGLNSSSTSVAQPQLYRLVTF